MRSKRCLNPKPTHGSRTSLALLLFWLYLNLLATGVARLDLLGLSGVAQTGSPLTHCAAGATGWVLL